MTAEMAKMGAAPVPESELATRKAVLVGSFGRAVETTDGVAGILGEYVLDGVPLTELQSYTTKVEGVTPAAVQSAAAALLDPKAASIAIVGDAKQFITPLRTAYPGVETLTEAQVNLDSPTLK